ncbi:MAG: DNA polymerase III subunit gamma/tau [Gammaproteobacteria bacterium]|jgi:DNA polymerase-3 subunit gamma/tau|nr:DNA polymerase III subunit gamma/tau [Chromatiales bacterium]MDP6674047.1 DNA polymerase III subunit gamma/tau [Gammaproteobacteria bacterium]
MSYLVLARKWRPKTFNEVTGQVHIVQALENALDSGRVHHAFLFAGTRGVGKTTIARILAKALNCETGVSKEPCGECSACQAVDDGRFVDLIEVDAASRTGVDDMRDLLDNVQYRPAVGRFKVYLIDEVHMLSPQSFNALLKTLEEPPEHIKFLFATTDPQKLPVTVLSRCLQFNLKRLTMSQIVGRMDEICTAEQLDADAAALKRLGRAAAGSMRDGLSLLDQALAYGAERLTDADVAEMLGSMDRHRIIALLDLLVAGNGADLIAAIQDLDELVPDYEIVLDEIATALQRIAVIQVAGADAVEDEDELESLVRLAADIKAEQVQLYYQIAVTSRHDMTLAPDPRIGFEMALLRMLAFCPAGQAAGMGGSKPVAPARQAAPGVSNKRQQTRVQTSPVPKHESPSAQSIEQPPSPQPATADPEQVAVEDIHGWPDFVAGLSLDGAAHQLAAHSALEAYSPFEIRLSIETRNEHLLTDKLKSRLTLAVQQRIGSGIAVRFAVSDNALETAAARAVDDSQQAQRKAQDAIDADPDVQQLVDVLGGEVVPNSVQPINPESSTDQDPG